MTSVPPALAVQGPLDINWWEWLSGPSVAMSTLIILAVFTTSGTFMLWDRDVGRRAERNRIRRAADIRASPACSTHYSTHYSTHHSLHSSSQKEDMG